MIRIPYGRQHIDSTDLDAVLEVLKSDWLTQGPAIDKFESDLAVRCNATYATAFANATAALHISCRALGLGPGDLLWTSPNTFVASANCGLYCGAEVDFVEIDPDTYNMSVSALEAKLVHASKAGRLPKIVIPVHFSGQPCAMAEIAALARQYGFRVIEDASHAVGATYRGNPVGNCEFSDLTVFSFHPVKIITTGEGGMVMSRDQALDTRLKVLRSHGITRDPELMQGESEGPWYYQQVDLGFNYRITDLQAALGSNQLKSLDKFLARRRELVARYDAEFAGLPLQLPHQIGDSNSAWHLYVIRVKPESGKRRKAVFERLRAAGILVNVHYIPVHLQPYYRKLGFGPGDFPVAEKYYSEAISLPLYYDLTNEQQSYVISQVREALL